MPGSLRRQITTGEVLDAKEFALLASIYKVWPGIVTAYHAAAAGSSPAMVDVQVAVNDVRVDPTTGGRAPEAWPVIPRVPLGMPKGGGFGVAFPLAAGDKVLLLSFDLDPSAHRATGRQQDPVDTSRHRGGYWIALPFDITDPGAVADPGNALVVGQPSGVQVRITSAGVDLGAASPSDAIALASKVDANTALLNTLLSALSSYVTAIEAIADPPKTATPALVAAISTATAAFLPTASATIKATP